MFCAVGIITGAPDIDRAFHRKDPIGNHSTYFPFITIRREPHPGIVEIFIVVILVVSRIGA